MTYETKYSEKKKKKNNKIADIEFSVHDACLE